MARRRSGRFAACLVLGAGLLVLLPDGGLGAGRRPEWTVAGDHLLDLEVGLASVEGRYGFDVGEFNANLTLAFDGPGSLSGGGTTAGANPSIYTATGTWGRDEATGRTRVTITASGFQFEGVMDEQGIGLVGTHERQPGFGGGVGSSSGPLTLDRVPPTPASDSFALLVRLAQNKKGKITAAKAEEAGRARRTTATLQVWDGVLLEKGKVRGKLKVDRDGNTTGKLKIRGKRWSVTMRGPVDEDGFHALADVRTRLLDADDVAITVPVLAVPDAPPPKPPPPPRNQLDLATAFLGGGQVEIFRGGVPKRFFGKKVDLTIQFPLSVGPGSTLADPSSASIGEPRRFFITDAKGTTWGTASEPGSVLIDVLDWTTVRGDTIRLKATGRVATPSGGTRDVNVILLARVL